MVSIYHQQILTTYMSFQQKPSGPNNVLEYQASGLPFAKQTTTPAGATAVSTVSFPYVTKFFKITNLGSTNIHVGFTHNGVLGTNKFTLISSGSFQGDIRVTDLYVNGGGSAVPFEVVAGLTAIPRINYYILTGSLTNFSGSQEDYQYKGLGYDGLG